MDIKQDLLGVLTMTNNLCKDRSSILDKVDSFCLGQALCVFRAVGVGVDSVGQLKCWQMYQLSSSLLLLNYIA